MRYNEEEYMFDNFEDIDDLYEYEDYDYDIEDDGESSWDNYYHNLNEEISEE